MDVESAIIELTAKAIRHELEDKFVYGDNSGVPNQFDGLIKLINTASAGAQLVAMGAAGATLTLTKIDELVDAVKGGKPDLLLMSGAAGVRSPPWRVLPAIILRLEKVCWQSSSSITTASRFQSRILSRILTPLHLRSKQPLRGDQVPLSMPCSSAKMVFVALPGLAAFRSSPSAIWRLRMLPAPA